MSSLVYSSSGFDHLSSNSTSVTEADSPQVVTSAFYCRALDAICVTTHEHNIMFYHCDGLQQFRQVLRVVFSSYITHTFNGPFTRTIWVSRYQKSKTSLDFTEARDSEWQWHQLGHMQVCISLHTDNHASTPPLSGGVLMNNNTLTNTKNKLITGFVVSKIWVYRIGVLNCL